MKIAVWSPTPFAGRKSANLLLLVLQTIAEEGGEQLIVHLDPEGSGPEHFLLSGRHRTRMVEQKEFGVEFLCRLLHCERFSKEAVINAAYTFADGKLHILPPGNRLFYEGEGKEVTEAVCGMIQQAGDVFQNVWTELPAGMSERNARLLSDADCVIVNLGQSPCEVGKIGQLPKLKNVYYLVGAYEQRNIYAVNNIMLLFPELRGRCAGIPYNQGFLVACCAGEAERFWMRGVNRTDEDVFPSFFQKIEKVYEKWKEGCDKAECRENDDEKKTGRNLLRSNG